MQNKKIQELSPNDLINPESFRRWIKTNLEHLYVQKNIPSEHLLIYLDYIRKIAFDNSNVDRSFWMKIIRNLENDIKSIQKMEG